MSTIPINLTPEKRRIFTLDDDSAHFIPEVEEAFFKKGSFLIIIGGGITGDIQVNDISYRRQAKPFYRKHEVELMLKNLQKDQKKNPPTNSR